MVDKTEDYGYNEIYYSYDAIGNVTRIDNGSIIQQNNSITRDKYNRVVETYNKYELHDQRLNYAYTNNFSEQLETETYNGMFLGSDTVSINTSYACDQLDRPTRITVKDKYNNGYRQEITYYTRDKQVPNTDITPILPIAPFALKPTFKIVEDGTTPYIYEVKTYKIANSVSTLEKSETVSYDDNGNITSYGNNSYVYDGIGRLTRENNAELNKSFTYEYDSRGNVVSKKTYAYTTGTLGDATATLSYTYDGYDRLTNTGYLYDSLGNPTSYNGKTLTWERCKLKTAVVGNKTLTYTYDGYGRQVKKQTKGSGISTINQTIAYDNYNRLLETQDNNGRLTFIYNSQGVVGCYYDGILYTYRKNLFGDITAIYQGATCVAKYKYDAWGNCTVCNPDGTTNTSASFIGNINPFRYRGYYWDKDLQLYNLQTRWYDPIIGRFISPDSIEYLDPESFGGLNLYGYCLNNPVNYKQIPISSGGSVISSSISVGDSFGDGNFDGVENPIVPWWVSMTVGAYKDFILGIRYLTSSGMHSKFAYATNTRYMFPIMGGAWRWFGKSSSNFGTVAQGIFNQILTGDARAGFGAIAKSVRGVVGLNALVNFGFNLCENNWQVDSAMLVDTAIDTVIGVASYYLAAGAMSFATAGLLAAGVALPGIVVVGGIVILSIGFEHVIRTISGYWE